MKKLILIALTSIALTQAPLTAKAQLFDKGTILIDAYYGWPNLYTYALRTAYASTDYSYLFTEDSPFSVTSIGPMGIKFEYLFSRKAGIGLHVNYARSAVSYIDNAYDQDSVLQQYTYEFVAPRFRIMPTFNFHFGESEIIDPYLSLGLGYAVWLQEVRSDDPNFPKESAAALPTATRAEFGIRYFFTKNFGGFAAVGIGSGPIFSGGLSTAF